MIQNIFSDSFQIDSFWFKKMNFKCDEMFYNKLSYSFKILKKTRLMIFLIWGIYFLGSMAVIKLNINSIN